MRGRDGRLLQVEEIWHAEAERDPSGHRTGIGAQGVDFIHATAESAQGVWAKLRRQAELADVRRSDTSAAQAS